MKTKMVMGFEGRSL